MISRTMSGMARRVRGLSVERWGEARAVTMIGEAPIYLEALHKIEKLGRYRESVLVTGESGAGKEHVAQALYLLGQSADRPYVSVNCPQFQEGNLTVSELFGHKKGSFTGAIADRTGAFQEADGGTIFLDEIGDLPPSAQAMLLRALATGEFRPLGASKGRSADVRVVAATNRPLNRLLLSGEFRHDLFFRLRHFHIDMPPLRARGDDWRLILDAHLLRLRERYGIEKRLSPAAESLLAGYSWPGNVRQLIAVATTGYAMADDDRIEPQDFASQLDAYADVTPLASSTDDAALVNDTGVRDASGRDAAVRDVIARDAALREIIGREGAPVESSAAAPAGQDLLAQIIAEGRSFWATVYEPFLNRDLNRAQVKAFVRQGLAAAEGSYRQLVSTLRMPAHEYQRFMDFLRHHDLKP